MCGQLVEIYLCLFVLFHLSEFILADQWFSESAPFVLVAVDHWAAWHYIHLTAIINYFLTKSVGMKRTIIGVNWRQISYCAPCLHSMMKVDLNLHLFNMELDLTTDNILVWTQWTRQLSDCTGRPWVVSWQQISIVFMFR